MSFIKRILELLTCCQEKDNICQCGHDQPFHIHNMYPCEGYANGHGCPCTGFLQYLTDGNRRK